MIEHLIVAVPALHIDGDRILGTLGSGGIATGLTVALVAGTRKPKATAAPPGAAGGEKGHMRVRLTSQQAEVLGLAAGTFYMAAGSIWRVSEQVGSAFNGMFTDGAFGHAGPATGALVVGSIMYFRSPRPSLAALLGILAAVVWSEAGGIWGLPQALILTAAQAIGLT